MNRQLGIQAITHLQNGEYQEALKFLDIYIEKLNDSKKELNTDDAMMYYNRSIAKTQLSNNDGAIKDLSTAISIDPTFHQFRAERGRILLAEKRYGEAIQDYTMCLEINPAEAANYLCQRGYANFNSGNQDQGLKDFVNAFEMGSKEAEKILRENTNYFDR